MIKILVDSSADYSLEEIREKGLEFIPIYVNIDEKEYKDGVDLQRDEFYELLQNSDTFPSTSQPSPQEFIDIFQRIKDDGDELICIVLSSKFSGTYQTACMAKDIVEYDKIHIIDSEAVTHATRILVDYGIQLIQENFSVEDVVKKIETLKSQIKVYAVVDTLDYLYKGGRIGKAAAILGGAAKIKPIISLHEGEVVVAAKSLGKKKAMNSVLHLMNNQTVDEDFPIYSLYTYGLENTQLFEEELKEAGYQVTNRLQVGTAIGTHVGPNAYGVIFVEK